MRKLILQVKQGEVVETVSVPEPKERFCVFVLYKWPKEDRYFLFHHEKEDGSWVYYEVPGGWHRVMYEG